MTKSPDSEPAGDQAALEEPVAEVVRSSRRRVHLPGISSRAWEHPADRGALVALRELRGFDDVLKALSGMFSERTYRLRVLGSAIRADERQHARTYRLFAEAAAVLDIRDLPELYVRFDPLPNAMTLGMKQPFVVVSHSTVERFDDDELRFVLGHELGHAASGHALYQTILGLLVQLAASTAWVPVSALALRGIVAAMYEWARKAELSADRAGLLAGQDPAAALRVHMRSAGGGDLADIDITAFLEQATEYERAGDVRDSLVKLMLLERDSHPMPVARAAELRSFVDSGDYQRILAGTYPRRADDRTASLSAEAAAAAKSYRDAFAQSQDPLAKLLRRVTEAVSPGAIASEVGAFLRRLGG